MRGSLYSKNIAAHLTLVAALALSACGGGGNDTPTEEPIDPTPPTTPTTSAAPFDPLKLDLSFGDAGSIHIPLGLFNSTVTRPIELADGKLLVAGRKDLASAAGDVRPASSLFVKRYNADGQPDESFGDKGSTEFSLRGADHIGSITLADDEQIYLSVFASRPCTYMSYVHGNTARLCYIDDVVETEETVFLTLSPTGELDAGPDEKCLDSAQLPTPVLALAPSKAGTKYPLADGRYLLLQAAYSGRFPTLGWSLSLFNTNGTQDTSFGDNGFIQSRCRTDNARVMLDDQNNVWLLASTNGISTTATSVADFGVCIEKFTATGAISPDMPDPVKTAIGDSVTLLDAQPADDGAIHVVARINQSTEAEDQFKILKYQANGTLASTHTLESLHDSNIRFMSVQLTDKQGSTSGMQSGIHNFYVDQDLPNVWARWNADGSLDRSFGSDGILTLGDVPERSARNIALVDSQKRCVMQTSTRADSASGVEASTTFTRYAGDSE